MKRTYFGIFTFFLCAICLSAMAQETKKLNGNWRFGLDKENVGIAQSWYKKNLDRQITVPGTTDEGKYGEKTTGSDFGILTRAYKYVGPAWYQTDIEIPEEWKKNHVFLKLERVMWQSTVFLDDKEISSYDALNSAHFYDLSYVKPGKHRLTVRVNNDMIYNIGDKGHVYGEYTQSIWNGIVGKVELIAKSPTRLNNPQVYTKVFPTRLEIRDTLINEDKKKKKLTIAYELSDFKTGERVYVGEKNVDVVGGEQSWDLKAEMPSHIKLWDDVHPHLYVLNIKVKDNAGIVLDQKQIEVGFREISASKSKIMINGKPVFFRGNLDCVHFPLTGYPAMDVEEWERIFRIYKDYGLNHVRFHSWCPPEAAFQAANRLGLFLQPEVIWLDWWMAVDNPGREEMNTQGRPKGLGHNPSADAFVQKEIYRMHTAYGNHPSFTTMSIGNELGNSDFDVMESWLKPYKERDPRRLYSVSSARKITAMDQFIATHNIDKIGGTRGLRGPHTDWDLENVYSQSNIPVIAHEIGQWPVYPRWDEIKKYTGVLKARNLEEFREQARKNKIEEQNEEFVLASGALNQITYKAEIESFLRTPSCAGIQLLSMQDYQGQGEALIGWLDVFYDSKGITTPEKFRRHHDTTVTLLRIPKFVYKTNEVLSGKIQLAHYGTTTIQDGIYWVVRDELSREIARGKLPSRTFAAGTSDILGEMKVDLSSVKKASKLTIEIGLESRPNKNQWNIWVYPNVEEKAISNTHITNRFDAKTEEVLAKGGTVLLNAAELGNAETADILSFYPLYWSLTFFPGQGKNTLGMIVRDKHPAFEDFPTDSHSDWQWQAIYSGARAFYINDFPASYRPIAQPVDDFHRNNKLAGIFEMKVGKGKLLVSGFNFMDEKNMVSTQLKHSLLEYASSDRFDPSYERDVLSLRNMFSYTEPLKSVVPEEFSKAVLYVEAGKNATKLNQNLNWDQSIDQSESKRGTTYKVKADGVWKDEVSSAWQGSEVRVDMNVPEGMIGSLYVFFHDWNNNGRDGDITFEGRKYTVGRHQDKGKWIKLHVMREDTNDGVLKLNVKSTKGPNIMISKIALVEDVE